MRASVSIWRLTGSLPTLCESRKRMWHLAFITETVVADEYMVISHLRSSSQPKVVTGRSCDGGLWGSVLISVWDFGKSPISLPVLGPALTGNERGGWDTSRLCLALTFCDSSITTKPTGPWPLHSALSSEVSLNKVLGHFLGHHSRVAPEPPDAELVLLKQSCCLSSSSTIPWGLTVPPPGCGLIALAHQIYDHFWLSAWLCGLYFVGSLDILWAFFGGVKSLYTHMHIYIYNILGN